MTTPVFPVLAGQGFSVHKKPQFGTLVAPHVSGREVRDQLYVNPIWNFEAVFNGLDGTTTGQYGAIGAQSMQALMGLFLQLGGRYGAFLYYDPTDYAVVSQGFGVGDGSTTAFQLVRTLGGFAEWIVAPVTSAGTLYFPGFSIVASAPKIYAAGTLVSAATYSIVNGLVSFTAAPANGAALTWTGWFGFLCRFDDDALDFEQFMQNLWRVDLLKFRSVRAQ